MIDRQIGISGVAISLMAWCAPLLWPNVPEIVPQIGFMIGVLLMGLALGLAFGAKGPKPQPHWTSLKLQFYGDHRIPTEVVKQNVDSWYALWTESRQIDFKDAAGNIIQTVSIPKQWSIFVQLEKPATYREVVVSFGIPNPPMYELKAADARYMIIFISADPPATTVEIYAKS